MNDDDLNKAIDDAAREATRVAAEVMTDEEAADWLKTLHGTLWETRNGNRGRKWSTESRKLTLYELDTVLALAPRFALSPYNAVMGFGIGIAFFAHPAMPGTDPTRVAVITSDHLSEEVIADALPNPDQKELRGFEAGWALFSPLTHREQNEAWLKLYGLPEVKNRSHYEY